MYDCISLFIILHFTELPLCKDTEDITMSPAVTDVTYSIVTGDTKTVRVDSLNGISAAEIHSSIPMVTVISFMLQLWDLFIILGITLALSPINLKNHYYYMCYLQSFRVFFIFSWSRTKFVGFLMLNVIILENI